MAFVSRVSLLPRKTAVNWLSTSACVKTPERFGSPNGESGWKWEKGGVGMGGKTADKATEAKPSVGKAENDAYKSPEYFAYNEMSFYDIEKSVENQRVPQ